MVKRGIGAIALALLVAGCPSPKGPAYFVVSERAPAHGDSFVIRLDDPDFIAHARNLIRHPEAEPAQILVATIEEGAGELPNQDFLNGGQAWSWHVSEVKGFAEFTIEILDGWPTYVEENLDDWFANTGGMIGFWSYTITEEVTAPELKGAAPRVR